MPAPKLLAGLPKPVLFGLYGAVGGLLGALVLGEPLWMALKPPAPAPVAQLGVSASSSVQIYPGTENTFTVQIVRERFDGPVAIRFSGLPAGVAIEPVTIGAGTARAEVRLTAAAVAPTGTARIAVVAAGGDAAASTALDVVVAPIPPPPPRMAIALAPGLLVYRRGTCKFSVQVARAGFDDPVSVSFASLPRGITVDPITIERGRTEAEATLRATDAAVFGPAQLTAIAGSGSLAATAHAELVVANPPPRPADIMFVLDCSGSMEPFIDGVKDGIRDFVGELRTKQIDFRLGLLAFRDRIYGQEPELLTFAQKSPFTTDTRVFAEKVGKLRCIGNDTTPESSLDGAVAAAGQPFRSGAARVLLLITDAEPLIPDKSTQSMGDAVGQLKEKKIDQLHVVVRRADRRVYERLQEGAGGKGKFFDLERVTRGGEKFAAILPELSREIADTVAAKPAKAEVAPAPPPPSIPAASAAQPTAAEAPPAPAIKSLQSSEAAAAGSEGRIVLRSALWAGAIAALVCLALLAGQQQYLRGARPAAGTAAAGILGGLTAGIVGGAAGQALYLAAPENAALGIAFRILGWALLGGLAGIGLSLFIPNMRWTSGLAGGAIGGTLGAAGFLAAAAATNDLAGRLIGGLLLGFCIGLMVAVVEAAFRRAWLEVRYGARETITVNLGPEPVKVGGDSRMCTVWARGAAPVALRYFIRDGQVICDDAAAKRESIVGEGTVREVGNVTVTVRTGAGAAPAVAAPPRPAVPPPRPGVELDPFPHPVPKPAAAHPPAPRPVSLPAAPRPPIPAAAAGTPAGPTRLPTQPAAASPKNPDGCPTCGRLNSGPKGSRYCLVCDQTY